MTAEGCAHSIFADRLSHLNGECSDKRPNLLIPQQERNVLSAHILSQCVHPNCARSVMLSQHIFCENYCFALSVTFPDGAEPFAACSKNAVTEAPVFLGIKQV